MRYKKHTSINEIPLTNLFFIIANFFFLVSAIFAVYYYKERCLYIDSAFQILKMISFKNFNFEAARYGVFFTQILPILAIKLSLPLKVVLIITSLMYVTLSPFLPNKQL